MTDTDPQLAADVEAYMALVEAAGPNHTNGPRSSSAQWQGLMLRLFAALTDENLPALRPLAEKVIRSRPDQTKLPDIPTADVRRVRGILERAGIWTRFYGEETHRRPPEELP